MYPIYEVDQIVKTIFSCPITDNYRRFSVIEKGTTVVISSIRTCKHVLDGTINTRFPSGYYNCI